MAVWGRARVTLVVSEHRFIQVTIMPPLMVVFLFVCLRQVQGWFLTPSEARDDLKLLNLWPLHLWC